MQGLRTRAIIGREDVIFTRKEKRRETEKQTEEGEDTGRGGREAGRQEGRKEKRRKGHVVQLESWKLSGEWGTMCGEWRRGV